MTWFSATAGTADPPGSTLPRCAHAGMATGWGEVARPSLHLGGASLTAYESVVARARCRLGAAESRWISASSKTALALGYVFVLRLTEARGRKIPAGNISRLEELL